MDDTFKQITAIVKETIIPVIGESARIAPDALLYGTGILSFLTQSYPLAVLLLAILEITLGFRIINTIIKAIRPDLVATIPSCRQGFPETGSLAALAGATVFGAGGAASVPHFTVSLLTGIAVYLIVSMWSKIDTLSALGESWEARIPTSLSLTIVILSTFIFGLFTYGCLTMGNLLLSLGSGAILGGLSFLLHDTIFTPDATNFHGLPLLLNKFSAGEPVYVCSK